MNPTETEANLNRKQPSGQQTPIVPPAQNTATKVINGIIWLELFGRWKNLIGLTIGYVVVFLPFTVIFTPKIAATSIGGAAVVVICFGVLPLLGIIFQFWVLRRRNWAASTVEKESSTINASQTQPASTSEPTLLLAISGVMVFGVQSYGVAGLNTEIQHPDNTLLVTDQGLNFIYVPMPGADNQLTNTQYITTEFNKKGIAQQLESMRSNNSLSQIIGMDKRNWLVPYSEIAQIKLSNWQKSVKVKKRSGETRTYHIGGGENWDNLRRVLGTKGY